MSKTFSSGCGAGVSTASVPLPAGVDGSFPAGTDGLFPAGLEELLPAESDDSPPAGPALDGALAPFSRAGVFPTAGFSSPAEESFSVTCPGAASEAPGFSSCPGVASSEAYSFPFCVVVVSEASVADVCGRLSVFVGVPDPPQPVRSSALSTHAMICSFFILYLHFLFSVLCRYTTQLPQDRPQVNGNLRRSRRKGRPPDVNFTLTHTMSLICKVCAAKGGSNRRSRPNSVVTTPSASMHSSPYFSKSM